MNADRKEVLTTALQGAGSLVPIPSRLNTAAFDTLSDMLCPRITIATQTPEGLLRLGELPRAEGHAFVRDKKLLVSIKTQSIEEALKQADKFAEVLHDLCSETLSKPA